jgi:energy-converting hydrogenase Eha subunit A
MKNKRAVIITIVIAVLLLIPAIAMQFTNEVNWETSGFIIAAALLSGTGLVCEVILGTLTKPIHKIIVCGIIVVALLLVWAEMAVGIFGSPFAGS